MRLLKVAVLVLGSASTLHAQNAAPLAPSLAQGKQALSAKHFVQAKNIFAAYARQHPEDVQGTLGVADAELELHEYEAAELEYRQVVAKQPLLWAAHKNLVIVEAALGRWEEFDREREVLRAARARGATGISAHESDVIDVLMVRRGKTGEPERWIVRDYFEPEGRSRTRYNFERFSAEGKVLAYVSLESADAFEEQAQVDSVVVGSADSSAVGSKGFALDWYDGKSHGQVAKYASEPAYEVVRAEFLRWLATRRRF